MTLLLTYKVSRHLGGLSLIIGMIFKIQHWPYSSIFLLIGSSLIFISFVSQIFISEDNNGLNYLILGAMTFIVLKIYQVEKYWYVIALLIPGLLFFVKKSGIIKVPKNAEEVPLPDKSISIISLLIIAIGLVFKFLHYPGFTLFLIVATLVQIIHLVRKYSKKEQKSEWGEVLDNDQLQNPSN